MRYYNGQELELLAPSGNFEIFQSIIKGKCDAVYFGGQTMNMRLIRKGFNFTDDELKQAVHIAHDLGKKAYITVNNLVDPDETEHARKYLSFLAEAGPDALIIQDFAVVSLINEMNLPLVMHSSVMMNVFNLPTVLALKELGIKRVVMSRNNTLADIQRIKAASDIEIEYFTHGDMCIAHGAQCYYSGLLFGMSSNRGKCLKPCRWWFSEKPELLGVSPFPDSEKTFPMAVKDMCMYPYLPEMIQAGVNSFKIEGRMRDREFITRLVDWYGDAMDRFIADPSGWDPYKDLDIMHETRKRDFSTASAFGRSGAENLNVRYEGTGHFFSTGKMFSTPTPEMDIADDDTERIRTELAEGTEPSDLMPKLSVRVNNMAQALAAAEEGVDRIYLAGDVFNPDAPFTLAQVQELKKHLQSAGKNTELYMGTPRMMNESQLEISRRGLEKYVPFIDGIMTGNLGAIHALKDLGLPIAGDFSLNIFNSYAVKFYRNQGLSLMTGSIELTSAYLNRLCLESGRNLELIAHGRLEPMYFDHDFYYIYDHDYKSPFKLYNEGGEYDIYMDQSHRTHMLTTHRFTLLPVLKEIMALKPAMLRIEAQTETTDCIKEIIRAFRTPASGNPLKQGLLKNFRYSYEALRFR